ncbi:MAG TPA: helix-turn-helix domain-containing protein [Thermoanaerobaculales bacterium]|nr:helix-turn-helix domain-containing protein [Thermoanaerobaculales bacterium]
MERDMSPAPDRWLSVDEIAKYLGVSRDTVYAWVSKKDMPGHRVGRLWKFKTDEVDGWVREGGAARDPGRDTEGRQ